MKFAIAVPILGQTDFLPSALASLRAQNEPLEVAILDATLDESVQAVLASSGLQPAYTRHGPDSGQAAAIAEGWNRIDGDVLAWLCADDYYFPHTLACVAQAFREDPGLDVVFGNAVHVNGRGDFLEYFPAIDDNPSALRLGCCIAQPACFVRRGVVERLGGLDTSRHYTMDWDLWLRLHDGGARFRFVDVPLAAVRIYPQTKTLSKASMRYAEIREVLGRHAGWWERISSLMGFRYYDMVHRRNSLSETISYWLLSSVKTIRSLRRRSGRDRSVCGLGCWTNRVQTSCEILVPWWRTDLARQAVILADYDGTLAVGIGNHSEQFDPSGSEAVEFAGRQVSAHAFHVPLPASEGHVVSLRLSTDKQWTLYGIRFNP